MASRVAGFAFLPEHICRRHPRFFRNPSQNCRLKAVPVTCCALPAPRLFCHPTEVVEGKRGTPAALGRRPRERAVDEGPQKVRASRSLRCFRKINGVPMRRSTAAKGSGVASYSIVASPALMPKLALKTTAPPSSP